MSREHDTIIIGAGLSGLAAAVSAIPNSSAA